MAKYSVVIMTASADLPMTHELAAAAILAQHFKSDVVFLRPQRHRTPDVEVRGITWEIKSPKGDSKKTIENNLRTARKQSENIIIDLARSKMHSTRAVARMRFYVRTQSHGIKRLKVITKKKRIIDVL